MIYKVPKISVKVILLYKEQETKKILLFNYSDT